MVLADRKLDGYDYEITLQRDEHGNLRVVVEHAEIHSVEWVRAADNGKEALDIYKHPFAYGLKI
jgi:hypothetical protein